MLGDLDSFIHCNPPATARSAPSYTPIDTADLGYMLNYARQTLKRVPSFQELLYGAMGSAKEEMYAQPPHRPRQCARRGTADLLQFRRRPRYRRGSDWSRCGETAASDRMPTKECSTPFGRHLTCSGWPLVVDCGLERDSRWTGLHRRNPRRLRTLQKLYPRPLSATLLTMSSSTMSAAMSSSPTTNTLTTASTRPSQTKVTGIPTSASPMSATRVCGSRTLTKITSPCCPRRTKRQL